MGSKSPFDVSRTEYGEGQMDASGLQSIDCLISEVWVSGKDAPSDKMKTLLGKSYP